MDFIKINRLRGTTADFTDCDGSLRVTFKPGLFVDLELENWTAFIDELTEAIGIFRSQGTDAESAQGDNTEDGEAT